MKKQILAGTMALMMGFGGLGSVSAHALPASENEFYQDLFGAVIDDLFPQQGAETYTEDFLNQVGNEFWKEIVNGFFSDGTSGTDTGAGSASDKSVAFGVWETVKGSEGMQYMSSLFPGIAFDGDGNECDTIMEMIVGPWGVVMNIYDETGAVLCNNNSQRELSMYVQQSSCLEEEFSGMMQANSQHLFADNTGSALIIQDMRMLAGNTLVGVNVPLTSGERWFCYYLPHNGNFRDMYDALKETWV